MAATSPLSAAERGLQVLQEPAHAAPDPRGPFLAESNHLRCFIRAHEGAIGAERIERPLEVYGLGCSPYTMPRQSSKAQNTRAFALNTLGGPPRAVSVCSSWRFGSWSRIPTFRTYLKVAPPSFRSPATVASTNRPPGVLVRDVVTERSTSRADSGRGTSPTWAPRLEKPSR